MESTAVTRPVLVRGGRPADVAGAEIVLEDGRAVGIRPGGGASWPGT